MCCVARRSRALRPHRPRGGSGWIAAGGGRGPPELRPVRPAVRAGPDRGQAVRCPTACCGSGAPGLRKANRAPSRLAGALSLWIGFGLSLRGTRLSRPVFDPLGRCRRPACGRWIRGRVLCLRGAAPRMRLGSGLPVGWVTRPRASDPGVCSGSARQPAGEPYLRRSVDIAHQAPLRVRQETLSIKPASETDCPAPGEPRPGLGPHSGQLPALEPAPAPRSMRSAGPSRGW
jgi:hypothetical protein